MIESFRFLDEKLQYLIADENGVVWKNIPEFVTKTCSVCGKERIFDSNKIQQTPICPYCSKKSFDLSNKDN